MNFFSDNKRKHKRFKKKLMIRHGGNKESLKSISITENISTGGAYFLSLEKEKIGRMLFCEISKINSDSRIFLSARVVRCNLLPKKIVRTYGIAIEFTSLSFTELKAINNIINSG